MAADSTIQHVLAGESRWCIHHGDMLDALPLIPDESVHAVVCDAPYGLSDASQQDVVTMLQCWLSGMTYRHGKVRKGAKHCAGNLVAISGVGNPDGTDSDAGQKLISFRVGVSPRYAVIRAVDLNNEGKGWEVEVNGDSPPRDTDNLLVDEVDSRLLKLLASRDLCLRKVEGSSGCIGLCAAFAQPYATRKSILVRLRYDSFCESDAASSIVARKGTELRAVLTLDVGRISGELRPAKGADEFDTCIELVPSELVGTFSRTRSLSAPLEPCGVCDVDGGADGASSFNLLTHENLLDRYGNPTTAPGGFMSADWDSFVPGPEHWRECLRILRPGGYLLTFAGTRTEDLMGLSIRLAGFERKDTIAFLHSQGMSKNVNLERQIAMHQCTLPGRHFASTLPKGAKARPGDHLCPETPDSVKWKGQGSALAPAHEPIIVARKPLRGTYAENTLEHGTALNIEATRIAHAGAKDFEQHRSGVEAIKNRGGSMDQSWKNSSDLSGASEVTTAGRWPKNVVLCHSEKCERIGTTSVGANPTWDTPNRATEPSAFTGPLVSKVRHGREGEASAERRYNENGSTSFAATPGPRRDAVEDVAVYRCVEGCPVALLAAQSGESVSRASSKISPDPTYKNSVYGHGFGGPISDSNQHSDAGTAARFFQQFHTSEFDEPFKYQAKPSRREKDRGLQHFRPRSAAEVTDSEDGQERLNNARTGAGRTGGARNPHPTTKSIELIRWMVRLVAQPGQLVCVPFAGSGSECVAALLEGCRVVGVELMDSDDEPYVSVACARCEHIEGREFVPRESLRVKEPPRQGVLF